MSGRLRVAILFAVAACGNKDAPAGSSGSGAITGAEKSDARDDWRMALHRSQTEVLAALRTAETSGLMVPVVAVPEPAFALGPAYIWVNKVGLVTIDGDAVTLTRFPDARVRRLTLASDGSLLVAGAKLQRVRGDQLEDLAGKGGPLYVSELAVAPDGTIWAGSVNGVWKLSGTTWEAAPPLGTPEHMESLDFDGSGRLFVTRMHSILVLDNKRWKPIVDTDELAKRIGTGAPRWTQTIVSPTGELWLLGCTYLVRVATDGKVTAELVPKDGLARGRFVAGELHGVGCLGGDTLVRTNADGVLTFTPTKTPARAKVGPVIDARGRLWATDPTKGIAIVNPDGSATTYPPGSIPAISGDVTAILVVGAGPDKLPIGIEISRGTITGTVHDRGVPVAGAAVEICRYPSGASKTTPCARSSDVVRGETDDNGVFRIAAALKTYRVAIKVNDRWYRLREKECTGIAPDGECSIGVVDPIRSSEPDAPP
ncbi:MAG: hypothetical protein H0T46_22750 [Deltaproteobacteria bacterium]|nr:hypothetical protein [Deltaproteobacteria bacterium]